MHRPVQVVLRDLLSEEEQRKWAENAITAVYTGLHAAGQNSSLLPSHCCPRYFFQVQNCLHAIKKWRIDSDESIHLLHLMGTHLHDYVCNSRTESAIGPNAATIIEILEDYAMLLQDM